MSRGIRGNGKTGEVIRSSRGCDLHEKVFPVPADPIFPPCTAPSPPNFHLWCDANVETPFFPISIPFFPLLFIRKTMNYLGTFLKMNKLYMCGNIYTYVYISGFSSLLY